MTQVQSRVDEAVNRYGKKVRVKLQGFYNVKNILHDNYFLFYDEDEVYHIEDSKTKKILYTFSASSKYEALDKSFKYLRYKLRINK